MPVVSPSVLRPDIPGPLSDLCPRCLAKDPADRYPSVRDLVADLTLARLTALGIAPGDAVCIDVPAAEVAVYAPRG